MGFTVTIVDPRSFEFRVCFHVDLVLGHCCSVPSLWHPGPYVRACIPAPHRPLAHALSRSLSLAPGTIVRPFTHPDHRPSLPAFQRPTVHSPMRCSVPSGTRDHRSTVPSLAPGTIVRACLHSDAPPSTRPCVVPFPLWHPGPSSEPACIPTLGPRPLPAVTDRHLLDTRDHAYSKEGDKSADRGLRLNRSRQQGRSTAYTTLIQLRGLRRI